MPESTPPPATAADAGGAVAPVLEVADRGRVRVLTFNRPEVRNAFNAALYRAVGEALLAARADDSVHAVVLSGAGPAFSAGQDLKELAALMGRDLGRDPGDDGDSSGFSDLMDALTTFDKPLLAAVNGVAVGIGMTLLLHCDMVIVAESARMKTPFAQMGVAPEAASSYLLPLRIGWQRAAEVLLAGAWLEADDAVDLGLALRAAPDDEVLPTTMELAERVAAAPLASLRAIKGTMQAAHKRGITSARQREDAAFKTLLQAMTSAT